MGMVLLAPTIVEMESRRSRGDRAMMNMLEVACTDSNAMVREFSTLG